METAMLNLKVTRGTLGVTQHEMAEAMGMPIRSYQDIEGGKNPVREVHVKAAMFAAIVLATRSVSGANRLPEEAFDAVKALVSLNAPAFARSGR